MPRYLRPTTMLTHAVWIFVLLSAVVLAVIDELRVEIEVDVINCTERAEEGDTILLTYNGTFEDGVSFDATRPGTSMNLTLGPSLIQGFNLGLFGACIGQTRRIFVPYRLGYGDAGAGGVIPPKTDIIFLVGVLDIFKPEPTETETDYVHEVTCENTTEFVTVSNGIDNFDTGDETNNNVIDIFKPEPTETETDYVHEVTYENTTEFVTVSNVIDDFDTGDETNNNVIDNNHGKGDGGGSRDRNDHVRRRPHRGRSFWWYVQFLAIPVLIILLIVDAYYLYKIYFPHGRVKFYKVRDHEPNDIVNTL